jgi:hypothetical protein
MKNTINISRFLFSSLLLLLFLSITGRAQTYNLSGVWYDDGGSKYRVKQIGNEIFWAVDASPRVINVFHGTIAGNSITGKWTDLPEGRLQNNGTLGLRIESNDRMVKVGSSFTYGASIWTRNQPVQPPTNNVPFLGIWKNSDHVHQGCDSPQSFCKAYKRDLDFTQRKDGKIETQLLNGSIWLLGTFDTSTRTYSFSVMNGTQAYGSGQFTFSSDYRSFTGNFSDQNGHRGYWNASK